MYKNLRVLFVGIPDMAYVCLEGMLNAGVNIVGVIGAKKTHNTYESFRNYVLSKGLNFIEYDNLDDENFINNIKSLDADIAVVCSFNYKIPKIMLESVKGGFINTHPALLPDYRGANPYSAVIINGEKYTGVTLHLMDEEFDTGDIVLQKKLQITAEETMGTLFNKLNALGLDMLLEILEIYSQGELKRKKQPKGKFKYASKITSNLIDFSKPAEEIERFIRALNPYIIAKTFFRGVPMNIFSADILRENFKDVPFGTIVKKDSDKFYIQTGNGLIAPTSMQFGGFFISSSKEFNAIINPQMGEVLKGDNFFG